MQVPRSTLPRLKTLKGIVTQLVLLALNSLYKHRTYVKHLPITRVLYMSRINVSQQQSRW